MRLHRSHEILEIAATMKVELASLAHSKAVQILAAEGVPGAVEVATQTRAGLLRGAEVQDAILPVFYAWLGEAS